MVRFSIQQVTILGSLSEIMQKSLVCESINNPFAHNKTLKCLRIKQKNAFNYVA